MSDSATDHPSGAGDQHSTGEHAATASSGVSDAPSSPTSDSAAAATTDTASTDDSFFPQDRLEALKGDPETLHKELQRAFTQKTQALSKDRKDLAFERELRAGLERDERGTIAELARHAGLEVVDRAAAQTAAEQTVDINERVSTIVREALGPEYEDLADKLAPAIRQAAETVTAEHTKQLATKTEQLVNESALRESEAVLSAFEKTRPDFRQHEPAMLALSQKYPPAAGVKELEYLGFLYDHVTRDTRIAEGVQAAIKRQQDSAATVDGSRSVGADKVAVRPSGVPTWNEAVAAAKAGVRFDYSR